MRDGMRFDDVRNWPSMEIRERLLRWSARGSNASMRHRLTAIGDFAVWPILAGMRLSGHFSSVSTQHGAIDVPNQNGDIDPSMEAIRNRPKT